MTDDQPTYDIQTDSSDISQNQWVSAIKILRDNNYQSRILCPVELSFKNENKIKIFSHKVQKTIKAFTFERNKLYSDERSEIQKLRIKKQYWPPLI